MRGAYPGFPDHLHSMSRSIVTRHSTNAGFVDCPDTAAVFLVEKAARTPWAGSGGRLAGMAWSIPLIRLFFGCRSTAWFLNSAICLIATKPGN